MPHSAPSPTPALDIIVDQPTVAKIITYSSSGSPDLITTPNAAMPICQNLGAVVARVVLMGLLS